MPRLETQKDMQEIGNLSFCYLCGQPFSQKEAEINRDHVPPRSVFAKEDRGVPLILPTHMHCNDKWADDDEVIGQLLGPLHGKFPSQKAMRLKFNLCRAGDEKKPYLFSSSAKIKRIVWRWVRGFHAALYKEYLPTNIRNFLHLPFHEAQIEEKTVSLKPVLPQQELFTRELKKNRLANNVDRIRCYGSAVKYDCVWVTFDDGSWVCLFGLDVYGWKNLGEERIGLQGCVGFYCPINGRPRDGTKATKLDFPFTNLDPLDPFGK